jgi:drug/metabolite transporter (DMT)-like permease
LGEYPVFIGFGDTFLPLPALTLILIAAILHASWNLVLKQARYKQVFLWWALLIGTLCFAVPFVTHLALPLWIWPYILSSVVMETAYMVTLTLAYDIDDFSLVYPIARGTAPVLLVLWAALFLNEPPRPLGLLGIFVLVVGLLLVGGSAIRQRLSHTRVSFRGIMAALITALCISIYTAIDGAAVRLVPAAPYTILVLGLSALLFAPVVMWRYGSHVLINELHTNWLRILLVGIAMLLTYILVLQAYTFSRVSYAGAVREVSVVIGAILGWLWLREGFGRMRTLGALLIFSGILIIAILG